MRYLTDPIAVVTGADKGSDRAIDWVPLHDFELLDRIHRVVPFLRPHATLPLLRPLPAQALLVNSSAGVTTHADAGQDAAKPALKALANRLRPEVNGDGIRFPGTVAVRTATPTQQRLHAHGGRPARTARLPQADFITAAETGMLCLSCHAEATELSIRPTARPDRNPLAIALFRGLCEVVL